MIDLKTAVHIIETNFSDDRIIGCMETNRYYGFSLYPRNRKIFEKIRSNIVPCVDKYTGKIVNILGYDFYDYYDPKTVDCSMFLSCEDAIIFKEIKSGEIKFLM